MHVVTASDKSINGIINIGWFWDSLVSLLQPLDLPLQFKVIGATRRHPTEEQKRGGGGGIIDEVRKESRQLLQSPNICAPLLIHLMFCFNLITVGLLTHPWMIMMPCWYAPFGLTWLPTDLELLWLNIRERFVREMVCCWTVPFDHGFLFIYLFLVCYSHRGLNVDIDELTIDFVFWLQPDPKLPDSSLILGWMQHWLVLKSRQ